MGNYTILGGLENPRRGRQARNLTINVPKILDLKSSSEQIISKNCRWVPLVSVDFWKVLGQELFSPERHALLYPFDKLIRSLYFRSFVVSQFVRAFSFEGHTKIAL